jgi:hypothetical protein
MLLYLYQRTSKKSPDNFKFEQKNTSSRAITQPKIIRPEQNSSLNCNSSRYSQMPNIKSIYQRTSRKSPDNLTFEQKYKFKGHKSAKSYSTGTKFELKLSGLFLDVFCYINFIFGIWLYLDELQFKFEFRSGRMIFGWVMTLELVFCSNFKLSALVLDVLWYIDLIFGMWLYLDVLQFKLEFRSGWMTFGWVMAIELVFFVQILSIYQRTSKKSPDNFKFEQKYKFKGHNSAKYHSTGTKFEFKL